MMRIKDCLSWHFEGLDYVCAEGRLVRELDGWRWYPADTGFEAGPWVELKDAINAVEAMVAEERKAA